MRDLLLELALKSQRQRGHHRQVFQLIAKFLHSVQPFHRVESVASALDYP